MAETANEQLRDAVIRHQTFLLRTAGGLRNRMNGLLRETEDDIAMRIRDRLRDNTGLRSVRETKRLEALQTSIRAIRQESWDKANKILTEDLTELALSEPERIAAMMQTVAPVQLATTLPDRRQLRAIITSRPFQGRLLREWAAKMADDDIRLIHNQIRLGMVAGEPSPDIARRVVGTARANGADGILEMSRRQVEAVVRTAVQHTANNARADFVRENADIIETETYTATLDSRTTPICRANDGKVFEIGKGPQPPLHINCRSVRVPTISPGFGAERPQKPVTERMLVREYAERNNLGDISSRDGLPRGTKGGFDKFARRRTRELVGPIPASTSYQVWLRQQSAEFQNDTLGVTKAKLFRDGGLQLDKFVHRNGDELTLAELARKDAEAFRAAGLDPAKF